MANRTLGPAEVLDTTVVVETPERVHFSFRLAGPAQRAAAYAIDLLVRMALLLAVDDATGTVPGALFQAREDGHGYFRLLWKIIESRGIPLSLYTDHHGVFWYTHQRREKRNEEPSADKRKPTQFGRAMRELGIEQVFAWSPQAKGRVERVAGTFQDVRWEHHLHFCDLYVNTKAGWQLFLSHSVEIEPRTFDEEPATDPTNSGVIEDSAGTAHQE